MSRAVAWATLASPVLAVLVAVGCGGGRASLTPAKAAPPEATPTWPVDDERARARIEVLDREIAARAATLDLPPPTLTPEVDPMAQPIGTCERSPRPVCQDVCTLADSICTAADEICKLAGQLAGDVWAAQRCAAGRGSCAAAHERCCRC